MKRDTTIDGARGIAIILVAASHMLGGLVNAGKLANTPAVQFANGFAYSFHVQIFFIVSGYFLFSRMITWRDFLPRAANLYYPYLLWSFISAALVLVSPGAVNTAFGWTEVAMIPVVPIQHYWFLAYLIISMGVLLIVRKQIELACCVLVGFSILIWSTAMQWGQAGPYPLMKLAYWTAFLLVGCIISKRNWLPQANTLAFVAALVVTLCSVAASISGDIPIRTGVFFLSSLAACYVVYCLAAWTARTFIGTALAKVGALSIAIYVAHTIFGAGLRTVTYKIWPEAPLALVATAGIAISVIAPMILYEVAQRLGMNRLLGFEPFLATGPKKSGVSQAPISLDPQHSAS